MQRISLGFLFLILAAAAPGAAWAAGGLACEMPAELTTPSDKLTHTAAALAKHDTLDILALGSGSTVGDMRAASNPALAYHAPESSFPYKMLEALEAMRPSASFHLTVKGGRNMKADGMVAIMRQELAAHHYDLVLWQTGTVEAVRGLRPDSLRSDLEDGADLAETARIDLVLIDPQFSRFLRANADLAPYETVLEQTAVHAGVTLFPRFGLTQAWVDNGQVDLERVARDRRDETIGLLNTCLGQALARYVLAGADAPKDAGER